MKSMTRMEPKGRGSVKKAEAKRAAQKKREEETKAKAEAKKADSDDVIAAALRQKLHEAGPAPAQKSKVSTEPTVEPLLRVVKVFLECEEFEEVWRARRSTLKRMVTTRERLTKELSALIAVDRVSGFPESLRTRGQELIESYASYIDEARAWQETIATRISKATGEAAEGWPPPSLWIAAELLPYNGKTIACTRFALYSRDFPGLTATHLAMVERLVHNNYFPDVGGGRRRRKIKLYSLKPRKPGSTEPATSRWATLLRLVDNVPPSPRKERKTSD